MQSGGETGENVPALAALANVAEVDGLVVLVEFGQGQVRAERVVDGPAARRPRLALTYL
jgi:hypothetical protein